MRKIAFVFVATFVVLSCLSIESCKKGEAADTTATDTIDTMAEDSVCWDDDTCAADSVCIIEDVDEVKKPANEKEEKKY